MSKRVQYRYRGTDRRGNGHYGQHWHGPGELAAQVERWFTLGWRELTVCADDGPVPPGAGEVPVAFIGRVDGKRAWWAETGEPHD